MPYLDKAHEPGTSVEVDTTDTPIVAANPARQELVIVNNDSTAVVWLRLAEDGATDGAVGIRLNPGGGNWVTNTYRGAVCGIASSDGTEVLVAEV